MPEVKDRFATYIVRLFFCGFLLSSVSLVRAEEQNHSDAVEAQLLAATAHRYFASNSEYRVGDLIVQSQVEEFQSYLRKTKGKSKATHGSLKKRAIPDHDPLAKLFYNEGHKELLRALAESFDGYSELHRLSKMTGGSKKLDAALNEGDWDAIVELLAKQKDSPSRKRVSKIFTVKDFIKAVESLSKPRPKGTADAGVQVSSKHSVSSRIAN